MSLLLLLGSLSVQAVSLQGRLRGEAQLRLQEAEDRLVSAAQILVDRIQRQHACLLSLPLEHWGAAGCLAGTSPEPLQQGEVLGSRWRLVRWQPAPPAAASSDPRQRLSLVLALEPADGGTAVHAAFELRLQGIPWRVRELRSLGLRGEPA